MNIEQVFSGTAASPAQILRRREVRFARQLELLQTGCQSLVSFSLNIPGTIKQFPLAQRAFTEGIAQLHLFLEPHLLSEESFELVTGSEAFLTLSLSPEKTKEIAISIEDFHPLGRLFDIDVLAPSGRALSRSATHLPRRKCIICGQDAKICGRSQAHALKDLQLRIAELLNNYFRDQSAQQCAVQAARALLTEVSATPKPGLVDRVNSGAHQDMDFFTFLDSSAVLIPWFGQMFCTGWDHSELSAQQLFSSLRFVGRQAEYAMLSATDGVNTHKELIFSLGLLCGAIGAVQARCSGPAPLSEVKTLCGETGKCACDDFNRSADFTNGLNCYRAYQIAGIRGEAAAGFPSAVQIGLPSLTELCTNGHNLNDASVITLLRLLSEVIDTNMIKRGGLEMAQRCRNKAKALLETSMNSDFLDTLTELDQQYIRDNLSPGGCADLLSISLMLYFSLKQGLLMDESRNYHICNLSAPPL